MDRAAWQATVHGIAKSPRRLRDFHFLSLYKPRESDCSVFDLLGLAQCTELCWQLRGEAGKRQVPGAKVALQHNLGLGGAAVVTLYKMGFPEAAR